MMNEKYVVRPGVVLVELYDVNLLIADKKARKYCTYIRGINEIGAFIWRLLDEKKGRSEILSELRREFDVPEGYDLEADVSAFLQDLEENNYLIKSLGKHEV